MISIRDNEQDYALLYKGMSDDEKSHNTNRYGKNIETVEANNLLRDQSLNINNDAEIGENPNRYKQHGFYFNADNCIGCHACEAACSEKNDNPAHIAFRSVGFVEGGSYPAYQRLNISMACNHCDDPVCLKGCPTRAYTKFAEYGAVLQDPDICFGCGYCTWVCPYNAPQLDPVKGEVSKCNMCVDRLEVGLKPSCVAACLGNALDFGVVEDIPENRDQAKVEIPGFPRTDITHPNIRFQQTRTPQRDMYRVDQTAIKYHRNESNNEVSFEPELDPKRGSKRFWNFKKLLGSHENAHIAFTLSVQTVMGAFLWLFAGHGFEVVNSLHNSASYLPTLVVMLGLLSLGLFKLNMHLGKPHRFYRGFYNLRLSPVSREIAGVSLFFAGLAGYTLLAFFENPLMQMLQIVTGLLALTGLLLGGYFMYKLYRIEARPFWNHINTACSFIATALVLGSLFIVIFSLLFASVTESLNSVILLTIIVGIMLEILGLWSHRQSLKAAKSEGAASFYEQTTTYGYSYWLRNSLLALALIMTLVMFFSHTQALAAYFVLAIVSLASGILGRALFYVVVIPTTMPGAFFWRNAGFVEHARETGLADMPQMGVAYERHHAFNIKELIETITHTSTKDKLDQLKRIFTG
ncbi:MAG: dimethyl sulfoxide reductase anchor subunit [Pseudomonadota bacterium]